MSRTNLNYGTFAVSRTETFGGAEYTARFAHPALKSAATSAAVFRAAIRLTPADLLADSEFRRLARAAAEKDKAFSADLLQWERKDVVAAAVAVVRAEVDAERAEAARKAAEAEAARKAREDAEAPTREAVQAAYDSCGFRACTQGHTTRVVVGGFHYGSPLPAPAHFCGGREWTGAHCDTRRGDRYSSRCTFRRVESVHTIYVRADYLARVAEVGGETLNGALVVDAEAVGILADRAAVYELRVVRQGAGTALVTAPVLATAEAGEWVPVPTRAARKVVQMPAPIIADYLEDRGAPTESVMPLRAGYLA